MEVRLSVNLTGHTVKKVQPLSEAQAVSAGADVQAHPNPWAYVDMGKISGLH